MGNSTVASGISSTAMGNSTVASGISSTAMGYGTIANGDYSAAMGSRTRAEAYASTVMGAFNIFSGDPSSWVSTDPLFVIGNGTNGANRSNAMTVLKNSYTGIGTASPKKHLHVDAGISAQDIHYSNLAGAVIEGDDTVLQIIGNLDSAWMSHLLLSGAPMTLGDNKHWITSHWGPDSSNVFGIGFMSKNEDGFNINHAYTMQAITILPTNNYVGINTKTPTDRLHVDNVMKIEPRAGLGATCNEMGMIYVDNTNNVLCFCDGALWRPAGGGSCS